MKYGIITSHIFKTSIGAVYILESLDEELYIVKEGNCDVIRKDAITLISQSEYKIIREAQNEVLNNLHLFSENSKEYLESLYGVRNKI
jgi:hypothetical protein